MLPNLGASSQVSIVETSKGEYFFAVVEGNIWHLRPEESLMLLDIIEDSTEKEQEKVNRLSVAQFLEFSSTQPVLNKINWVKYFSLKDPTFNST
mgnify:CR=1 FL=1